jgi:cell wall-associated NlpC family hydrolase
MTTSDISNFNKKIKDIVSLRNFKNKISKQELEKLIFQNDDYFPIYIDSTYYEHQDFSNNIVVNDMNNIRYAITIKRVNVRTFPTLLKATYSSDSSGFDQFQETTFEINEPVLVLTEDKSGYWLFVQGKNYNGWVLKKDVAFFQNKKDFINYIYSLNANFITTISSKSRLTFDTKEYQNVNMGTKFILQEMSPINGYWKVAVPIRDSSDRVSLSTGLIPTSDAAYQFLPYTRKNIIDQAFKMLNQPYGWGGKDGYHDCSSFIQDIFKTFGFTFPRNADIQEMLPGTRFSFKDLNYSERLNIIKRLNPGTLLFMKDHVMLYLGYFDNSAYVINDITSYYENNVLVREYKVAVTDIINARRSNSKSFLESLTTAVEIP